MANGTDEPRSAIAKWEEDKAAGRPLAEHIINAIKAGLGAVPCGGVLASLISDYIPQSRARRLEEFAERIAKDLRKLHEHIDADYLRTDDFAFMFEQCFRSVSENPQQEKLETFRGILVNSAIRNDISDAEKEFFLNVAMSLSALHIRILRFMGMPEDYLRAAGIAQDKIRGGFSDFFPVAIPGVSMDVIRSAFAELNRYQFTNTQDSIFTSMTSGQGLHLLGDRITPLGRRFIEFCTSPRWSKEMG